MKLQKEILHNELEEGFIDLGSPHRYPQDDRAGADKPEKPPLTSRDSRLHSDSDSFGSCCGCFPINW